MKWTVQELTRRQHQDNAFKATLNLKSRLEPNSDMLDIDKVHVEGSFSIEQGIYYHFDLTIDTVLTMACAITLEPVEVPLHIEVRETFSKDETDTYRQIEGITVDLLPIVWSNIYLEKPLRVVRENASFESDESNQEKQINPAFADLKKYKR